jgi:hypothetical protein
LSNDTHQHRRGHDVEHGADHQSAQDADGHVLSRVARFRSRGGDRLKAEIGKEDHRRAVDNAANPVFGRGVAGDHRPHGAADLVQQVSWQARGWRGNLRGDQRMPKRRVHILRTDADEGDDNGELDEDDNVVDRR